MRFPLFSLKCTLYTLVRWMKSWNLSQLYIFVIVTFILSLFSISVRRRIRTCIGCKTHVQAAVDTYLKITLFSFPLSSKKVDLTRQKPSWGTNWSYYVKTGLVDGQVLITNWQINVMLTQSRFINNCVKTG